MGKYQFGIRVPNSGPLSGKDNIVKAALGAEEMGFDSVWVHDHVTWSSEMQAPQTSTSHEILVPLRLNRSRRTSARVSCAS